MNDINDIQVQLLKDAFNNGVNVIKKIKEENIKSIEKVSKNLEKELKGEKLRIAKKKTQTQNMLLLQSFFNGMSQEMKKVLNELN